MQIDAIDKFHDECGVAGISGHSEAAKKAQLMLLMLQHRGQEAAGIVTRSPEGVLIPHRELGLVEDVLTDEVIKDMVGDTAIAHNRYSTAGASAARENVQPIATKSLGGLAIAHNGNLVNAAALRQALEYEGAIFGSTSDTEVILQLMAQGKHDRIVHRLMVALAEVRGAYSLLLLTPREMIVARDPQGFRPLALGRLDGAIVVASETCAFDLVKARYEREVEPGEILVIRGGEIVETHRLPQQPPAPCVFEWIYFARPDSFVFGRLVEEVRIELGHQLAREHPADADIVVPILASGQNAGVGYAEELKLPLRLSVNRNQSLPRVFISPDEGTRNFWTLLKHNPSRLVAGKRVVLVDDSIVRGTASTKLVQLVRDAGALEVHYRVSSPPIIGSCFYGIDTPKREKLIAHSRSLEEIRQTIGADSLEYLSLEGLFKVAGLPTGEGMCAACFNNRYPIPL